MSTINVSNISAQTGEKELREFFSFCGKISSLTVSAGEGETQNASVTFEKEGAARTALLFDNTQLGANNVKVTGTGDLTDATTASGGLGGDGESGGVASGSSLTEAELAQEDKPRARIIAEFLAHGYRVSDVAIERAITLDKQHGLSTRFVTALANFDTRVKASERAKSVDTSYGVTDKANAGWRGLNSYFEKAMGTPTGQRVRDFYTQREKEVRDIHSEARRLADLRRGPGEVVEKDASGSVTHCNCGAEAGNCPCEPGKCTCASCPKNEAVQSEKPATAAATAPSA